MYRKKSAEESNKPKERKLLLLFARKLVWLLGGALREVLGFGLGFGLGVSVASAAIGLRRRRNVEIPKVFSSL